MAFISYKKYNSDKNTGKFILQNDGDSADVIFLYPSEEYVQLASVHYLNGVGYVQCLEDDCPACRAGLPVQLKLFVPVYDVEKKELLFFQKGKQFAEQLEEDVFKNYPDPTQCVFRIIRHGVHGDMNTSYEVRAVGVNNVLSYEEILKENNTEYPQFYDKIIKDMPADEMQREIEKYRANHSGYETGEYEFYTKADYNDGVEEQSEIDTIGMDEDLGGLPF